MKYNTNKFEIAIMFGKFLTYSWCDIYEYHFQIADAYTKIILFNFYKLEIFLRKRQAVVATGVILVSTRVSLLTNFKVM